MSLLLFRSELTRAIRRYFYREGLLEVTTPLLRAAGSSEVHLTNISVPAGGYLQTSPEHAMKGLLARHRVSLFQICPAFRGGETGSRHRVEFQMLEWYRHRFSLSELMDDLVALLKFLHEELGEACAIPDQQVERVSYRHLFEARYSVNPHQADLQELKQLASSVGVSHLGLDAIRADFLDALFSTGIEPSLTLPTIVYDYPACQVALAETRVTAGGDGVSDRFELYINGLELANAYQELTDPDELQRRFQENNRLRRQLGKPEIPEDEELVAAVRELEPCAGIALGIDRLAMVLLGATSIDEVIP